MHITPLLAAQSQAGRGSRIHPAYQSGILGSPSLPPPRYVYGRVLSTCGIEGRLHSPPHHCSYLASLTGVIMLSSLSSLSSLGTQASPPAMCTGPFLSTRVLRLSDSSCKSC